MTNQTHTLTIKFKGALAHKIKDVARAQGVTYASLCRAALMGAVMANGEHVIMKPFGGEEFADCERVEA